MCGKRKWMNVWNSLEKYYRADRRQTDMYIEKSTYIRIPFSLPNPTPPPFQQTISLLFYNMSEYDINWWFQSDITNDQFKSSVACQKIRRYALWLMHYNIIILNQTQLLINTSRFLQTQNISNSYIFYVIFSHLHLIIMIKIAIFVNTNLTYTITITIS